MVRNHYRDSNTGLHTICLKWFFWDKVFAIANGPLVELVEQEGMGCTRQCLVTGIEAVPRAEYSHGLWQWQSNAPEVLQAP